MNRAAQKLGRLGGLARSKAKAAAARANGKLGGRPKKAQRPDRRHNSGADRTRHLVTGTVQPFVGTEIQEDGK